MRNSFLMLPSLLILMAADAATMPRALADPGLLLVAHGSPSAEWNKPVLALGARVAEAAKKDGRFKAVRTGLLESAQPDLATAVAELQATGCDRIVAVPLFIAPSGHTHFDVPAALGIYWSPKIAAALAAEHAEAARPKVPVLLTQTLAEGDLLQEYALAQVRRLSKSPKDEALVILAHGDPEHHLLVERLMRRVTTYCCGAAGITDGDWASIGVGQEYPSHGVAAIRGALERKKRVLVVGLYVSTTAARIHQRSLGTGPRSGAKASPFAQADVVFSNEPLVDHPELVGAVLAAGRAAIAPMPKPGPAAENGK